MHPSSLPSPGDLIGGKFRIVSSIGAGGMGVVFEAVHMDTEANVALKWLTPEISSDPMAVERFKVEARATGRIRHPNVVAIHDIAEHQGNLYLVMELLRGCSLRARLARGNCDLREACQILFPVMRGVAAAHAVHVLHRDLKPENIFLADSPDGLEPIPKVLDFGIAKLSVDAAAPGVSRMSVHSGFMGTYPYMAFEQLYGKKDLDGRVDVYALGAVLYNMLTGRLPYEADNPVDLALRMLQSDPEPVTAYAPSLPAELAPVVARALARERDERFASVDEFALALEPFAASRYRGSSSAPTVRAAASSGPISVGSTPAPRGTPPLGTPTPRSTPPLSTPYAIPERAVTTAKPALTAAPVASSRRWLYIGAVAAVIVIGAASAHLLSNDSAAVTAPRADKLAPPPLPSVPVGTGAKKAAAAGTAETGNVNTDWGAGDESQAAIQNRPSGSLPPSVTGSDVAAQPPPQPTQADVVKTPSAQQEPPRSTRVAGQAGQRPESEPRSSTSTRHSRRRPEPSADTVNDSELLLPSWATEKAAPRGQRTPK